MTLESDRPSTLAALVDVLGEAVIRLVTAMDREVRAAILFDAQAPLPETRDGLLLAVGVTQRAARAVIRDAAKAGFAGVVIKDYGEPLGDLAATAERAGIGLLAVGDEVPWHSAHLLISSTLSTGATGAATGPALGDLFALANAIAAASGGATAIEDPQQRILAYSTLRGQDVDDDRRQGILGRQVPGGDANTEQYRILFHGNEVRHFPALGDGLPRLAVPVRAGGEALGSIWVVDSGSLAPNAEEVLSGSAATAALHLLRIRATEELARRHQGRQLRRLLEGEAGPSDVDEDVPVRVAAFAITGSESGPGREQATLRLLDLVALRCEARYGRQSCVLIGRTVYALLPGKDDQRKLAEDIVAQAFSSLRVPVVAGLGGVVATPADAAQSREDADLVLRVVPQAEVATVEDVSGQVAILRLRAALSTDTRLRQGLWQRLVDHDERHGTEHARTVLCYLDSACDVAATAQRLAVHPNTCRYRLRQMQDQLGFDLADPDERLVLWLQLRTLAGIKLPGR
ncbi:helix-turn-helix domain-containing protein [Amycolatopsis sp. NPDC059657]|uniref:helix-turn-helix domain-containing protein n=1 Tax=Amycolatopsis sp. NPDC059657 TaxID=3346899 RepID=UPI00366B05F3